MQPGRIQVDFDDLLSHYPTYTTLPPALQKYMDDLNKITPGNTPCCVQMSHALNLSGQIIPSRSYRRPNALIGSYYYILAVDELEYDQVERILIHFEDQNRGVAAFLQSLLDREPDLNN